MSLNHKKNAMRTCLLYNEKPTVAYSSYARIDLRRYKARTTFVGEPLIGEVGQLNVN